MPPETPHIQFSPESKQRIFKDLQSFFHDECDEDLGELRTGKVLDFMVGLVGVSAYNQAITDAQAWMQEKPLDLRGELHRDR